MKIFNYSLINNNNYHIIKKSKFPDYFLLSNIEKQKLDILKRKWKSEEINVTFSFGSGIGIGVKVSDNKGHEEDITDYNTW